MGIVVEKRGNRTVVSTSSPWEPVVGYARAVRVGDVIAVTGTVGLEEDGSISMDAARQTRRAFEIIKASLEALGASLDDVVRTRIFVTNISKWEQIGRVHGEVLGHVKPATSMVEVNRLIDARCVVEIEADAIVGSR
jgi:enamine deaminase RidA (YjgF/YER057c/UK114 family)